MASLNRINSILDIISDRISPVMRRLSDVNQNIEGTATQLLRIKRVVDNHYKQTNTRQRLSVLGDFKEEPETFNSEILSNVIIKYPSSDIEVFTWKQEDNVTEVPITGIDINELLPIKAVLKFEGKYDIDPITIVRGDKIVDIFYDENQNPCPIILEVGRRRASFFGKNIVTKTFEMSIHRGKLPKSLVDIVDKYISEVSQKKKEIRKKRF